jgi:8-oxo-dGTP pyrophosphatase MutT (NUDIX family)
MKLDKWSVVSSETIHADRWLNVRADTCVTTKGETVSPYYVLDYPDWVQVVAITDDDQIVLIRQYRHAAADVLLELPGGTVDPQDDNPEQAMRRELLEETGFSADEFRHVISLSPNPATHTNMVHTYLALGARLTGAQNTDPGEDIGVELMPVSAVIAGLPSGLFQQSMHVASVVLALVAAGRISL